jgi:uracil-DNA glycosylase family 4
VQNDIVSIHTEGFPLPHEDLISWAKEQNCTVEEVIRRCLYGRGEYSMDFSLNKGGDKLRMQVIPGHRWGLGVAHPADGPCKSDLMIIGKSVLWDDLEDRRLFCGDRGTVLLSGLREAGFTDKQISSMYLSTVLLTEPLDSQKSSIPKLWIEAQSHLLWQQIYLVKPRVCLLQGNEALKLILGTKENLTSTAGKVFEKTYSIPDAEGVRHDHTIKFVTSMSTGAVIHERSHPDLVASQGTHAEQKFVQQLKFFLSVVNDSPIEDASPKVDIEVIDNTVDLEQALIRMKSETPDGLIAWDAEWQGNKPQSEGAYIRCVQFAWREDQAVVVALRHPGGAPRFKRMAENGHWTHSNAEQECIDLLKRYMRGLRVTGHYFIADLQALLHWGLDLRPEYDAPLRHEDVGTKGGFAIELAAHAWDETAEFGLDAQLEVHTAFNKYSGELETRKKTAAAEAKALYKEESRPFRQAESALKKAKADLRKRSAEVANHLPTKRRKALQGLYAKVENATTAYLKAKRQQSRIDAKYAARIKELKSGYGWIEDEILYPYAGLDAAAEIVLARKYIEMLKSDRFGNDCRKACWISHRSSLAALEINCTGMAVDRQRLDELAVRFSVKRDEYLAKLRDCTNWPTFNPRSRFEFAELLFGEEFNGYYPQYGKDVRTRPPGAWTLRAEPLRSTGKYPKEWVEIREAGKERQVGANTGKQTLGEMFWSAERLQVRRPDRYGIWRIVEEDHSEFVSLLRDFRYVDQALKGLIREPRKDSEQEIETDDEDNAEYDAGVATQITPDGIVRPTVRQTVETGRWAMRNPNLMAQSKSRDADFKRIFGKTVPISVRSIFRPRERWEDPDGEDWFFVEADYSGAELLVAAIMSQDQVMIDHCLRNQLPDDHPDYFDPHSDLTVRAFALDCAPTKQGLESIGKAHLRTVAKSIAFGILYGRTATPISIAVRQEGVWVSVEDTQKMIDAYLKQYSDLHRFLYACRQRVHDPGWMCNMFGRFRRFPYTTDESKKRAYEREAMNATIQGGVADAMSTACRNIIDERNRLGMRFQLCLQIHDAVMLHVPASELEEVINRDRGLLRRCMIDQVPLRPVDLNGDLLLSAEVYQFGSSIDVYERWGDLALPGRYLANGLDPAIDHWSQREDGGYVHPEKKGSVWYPDHGLVLATST